ncbi:MAG: hypothetical protein ABEJ05_01110 [Haloglomus sp.]
MSDQWLYGWAVGHAAVGYRVTFVLAGGVVLASFLLAQASGRGAPSASAAGVVAGDCASDRAGDARPRSHTPLSARATYLCRVADYSVS